MDKKKGLIIGGAALLSAAVVAGIAVGVKKLIKKGDVVAEAKDIIETEEVAGDVEVEATETTKEDK